MAYNTRQLFVPPGTPYALSQLLLLKQKNPQRYPYLLASSASGCGNTQYDILFACPQYQLTLDSERVLHVTGQSPVSSDKKDFFAVLDAFYQHEKKVPAAEPEKLPFTGGWFVYLSYEMAAEIESCLHLPAPVKSQPMAVAARCPAAIIVDKQAGSLLALAEAGYESLLDEIEQDFTSVLPGFTGPESLPPQVLLETLEEAPVEPYLRQVERIKQYIVDGDIFQANLSRLWSLTLKQPVTDEQLFQALAVQNPSSFAALAALENMTIISSSPERLVSLREGRVETRPIAGTRPRDDIKANDEALAKELLAHPKEQAEHIMLIDLERNDLGRVCVPGSIEVNELMTLESWQHVHHIVSNVRGELAADKSAVDVLRAVFPGGTITGCPKVRCMEILAEMEQQPRGAYTGSLGYINTDGSMDFNILIRTMVRDKLAENNISFRAGGGIVSDSIAEKELQETRAKAKGLLKIFTRN